MVLRLKTRESRSLPGLLKARNKPNMRQKPKGQPHVRQKSSLQTPARPKQPAALKRPFCFANIKPDNRHKRPSSDGTARRSAEDHSLRGNNRSMATSSHELARIRHSAKAECRDATNPNGFAEIRQIPPGFAEIRQIPPGFAEITRGGAAR